MNIPTVLMLAIIATVSLCVGIKILKRYKKERILGHLFLGLNMFFFGVGYVIVLFHNVFQHIESVSHFLFKLGHPFLTISIPFSLGFYAEIVCPKRKKEFILLGIIASILTFLIFFISNERKIQTFYGYEWEIVDLPQKLITLTDVILNSLTPLLFFIYSCKAEGMVKKKVLYFAFGFTLINIALLVGGLIREIALFFRPVIVAGVILIYLGWRIKVDER